MRDFKQRLSSVLECAEFDAEMIASLVLKEHGLKNQVSRHVWRSRIGVDGKLWEWEFCLYYTSMPAIEYGPTKYSTDHQRIHDDLLNAIANKAIALFQKGCCQIYHYDVPDTRSLFRKYFKISTVNYKGYRQYLYLYLKLAKLDNLRKLMQRQCAIDVRNAWFRFQMDMAAIYGGNASEVCEIRSDAVPGFLRDSDLYVIDKGGEQSLKQFCDVVGITLEEWYKVV
jgi:hypothetical protein